MCYKDNNMNNQANQDSAPGSRLYDALVHDCNKIAISKIMIIMSLKYLEANIFWLSVTRKYGTKMLSNYFNNITFYNTNCPWAVTNKEALPLILYF